MVMVTFAIGVMAVMAIVRGRRVRSLCGSRSYRFL
jgi:hypothetical protein